MTKTFLFYIFISFVFLFNVCDQKLVAQNIDKHKGVSLKGIVQDSSSKEILEYAAVILHTQAGKQIKSGTTDSAGAFTLSGIEPNTYYLAIALIGFKTYYSSVFTIPDSVKQYDLGKLSLYSQIKKLKEVEIVANKQLVESSAEGFIYNAQYDLSAQGGTAEDVLKNVPMVTVDIQGKPKLRGNTNFQLLINDKPSRLFANNIEDALRMIPADDIIKVEVVTAPSARYDGDGGVGIIKIYTKKLSIQGLTGSIRGSASYLSQGGNGYVNYRKKKFGLRVNGSINKNYYYGNTQFSRSDFSTSGTSVWNQQVKTNDASNYSNVGLNFDYDVDSLKSITIGLKTGGNLNQNKNEQQNRFYDPLLSPNPYDRNVNSNNNGSNISGNIGYQQKYRKPKRELNVLGMAIQNRGYNQYSVDQFWNGANLYNERNMNNTSSSEITGQIDFTEPLNKKMNLEIGTKGIQRKNESDYVLTVYDSVSQQYINDPLKSNRYAYTQGIIANYASIGFPIGKKI